ncbi:MAG: hypothetical protein ABIG95_05955 [Candidatus Woesearchaeota archaeon]
MKSIIIVGGGPRLRELTATFEMGEGFGNTHVPIETKVIIPYLCAGRDLGQFCARAARQDEVKAFKDEVEILRILNQSPQEEPLPFPRLVEAGVATFDGTQRQYALVPFYKYHFKEYGAADLDQFDRICIASRMFMARQVIAAVAQAHRNGIYGIELKPNGIMWNTNPSDRYEITDAVFADWNCVAYIGGEMRQSGLGTTEQARKADLMGLARVATCIGGRVPRGTEVTYYEAYPPALSAVVELGLRGDLKDMEQFHRLFAIVGRSNGYITSQN